MGVNNRQRRAAKAKRRAKNRTPRIGRFDRHGPGCRCGDGAEEPLFTPGERIGLLVHLAASAAKRGDAEEFDRAVDRLATSHIGLVDGEVDRLLLSLLAWLWDNGWQPAEAIRHATRADARAGRVVAGAVAADHARHDPATVHARWSAQVPESARAAVAGPSGWLSAVGSDAGLDRAATVRAAVLAMASLGDVGPLPTLIPPPGSTAPVNGADTAVDDPVLVKVRALLAQAESTTFDAEAAAFTAKAQELMARHAIDAALLWASSERNERPTTIRLPIDDPYADIKALLLHLMAQRSRCRAVRHVHYDLVSVVGFASDVAATELLFTSVLVQSQAALQAEAAKAAPGARTRSRSFRSSFLMSFTQRIDQRLAEINTAVEEGAGDHRGSLVPVLAARDDAVDDAVGEMFGELHPDVVRGGSDIAGWVSGKLAADLAQLTFADLDTTDDGSEPGPRALAVGM
ncbi:DUF2786 domain-containing protein [soil metagenome]